jgi:flagellar hook-length control protein FliK
MQRSGNSTATLRLDPPDLGELSVHISLSASAQVNVQLIPSVPQTAQLLNANLMDLRHAMTAAGLTLGQTQVGGNGTGGNQGQGTGQGSGQGQNGGSATPGGTTTGPAATAAVTEAAASGVRAYA